MRRRKAFTLIELLVVIAIIALLMAILMPSLNKARKQARTVICQSNLHQWALVWEMYTSDYDGSFHPGTDYSYLEPSAWTWLICLQDYYGKMGDIRCCPEAKPGNSRGGAAAVSWYYHNPSLKRDGFYGSYGNNVWVSNPGLRLNAAWGGGIQDHVFKWPTKWNWRTRQSKGADNIPVMGGAWYDEAWPEHTDEPPPDADRVYGDQTGPNMCRFCLDRHNGHVNMLFMDWSLRKVGLKELWTFKWHRAFDTRNIYTKAHSDWVGSPSGLSDFWDAKAPWMKSMPEY